MKGVEEITLRLIDKYSEFCEVKGRNVSFDNLYTSIPLAIELHERGMTCIGTVKFNRKGVPKEIRDMTGREENSSIIWYEKEKNKMSLTSFVFNTKPKGKKDVIILSTKPVLLGVTKDDGKAKPAIIKEYDYTKGGTDIVDQRSGSFTTSTKAVWWVKKTFSIMLDTTRVNSQTIYFLNQNKDPRKSDSFNYGWELGMSLLLPHVIRRQGGTGLNRGLQLKINLILRWRSRIVPVVDQVFGGGGDGRDMGQDMGGDGQDVGGDDGNLDPDEDGEGGDLSVWQLALAPRGTGSKWGAPCAVCKEDLGPGHKREKANLTKQKTRCQICQCVVCRVQHGI